jgi:hypothetical protein
MEDPKRASGRSAVISSDREPGAGSREPGAGSREPGALVLGTTCIWWRKSSTNAGMSS